MPNNFYNIPSAGDKIDQGDIFVSIPVMRLEKDSIQQIIETENGDIQFKNMPLSTYVPDESKKTELVVSSVEWKSGIIITQSCDASRDEYLTFCEIKKIEEVDKVYANGIASGKIERKVTFLAKKEYTHQHKYFYLLQDSSFFDGEKMVIDFKTIFQVKKDIIESLQSKRIAKLSETPLEHLRVKLANYFKRFAYDSWYILNKSEYDIYYAEEKKTLDANELKLVKPYPWHI